MKPTRRRFIQSVSAAGTLYALPHFNASTGYAQSQEEQSLFKSQWTSPPREFSQAPFWFWNDELTEAEITRQMQDFCDHGVYGFVIHPRAGLPRDIGWMSERMIHYMRHAIEEAKRMDMWVVLYDEGMYPSGSSSGQVVAKNPKFRPRGLFAIDLDEAKPGETPHGFTIGSDGMPVVEGDANLVAVVKRKANGHRIAVLDRFISPGYALIRGLHFIDDNPPRRTDKREVPENMPPLADILNPESVRCFIRLVYQRYYDEFSDHFGNTIQAMFTDEPSFFGKRSERGAMPGNAALLPFVNGFLAEDFTPYLPALWYKDEPDAERHRKSYNRALQARLEETFYQPISEWCEAHRVALTGHPAAPDDIGHLRYFQIPGQDIVWRYIEPGKPSALEGDQSTTAKCASSAMIHLGRRRNSNECCGAYGHNFTFREMKWLAKWLIVRGCSLLYPHAFYYSVRGPRIDERPPDVGPNNTWWGDFKPFADSTSRLCWLNTDSKHVCELAILGLNDYLPWEAAKVCFQHQIDFNYLEARHLWEDAQVNEQGIQIAGMHYRALIAQFDPPNEAEAALEPLQKSGRLIRWNADDSPDDLLHQIGKQVPEDMTMAPASQDIRIRHVIKNGLHCFMLFNEGEDDYEGTFQYAANGKWNLLDIETGTIQSLGQDTSIQLAAHELKAVMNGDLI